MMNGKSGSKKAWEKREIGKDEHKDKNVAQTEETSNNSNNTNNNTISSSRVLLLRNLGVGVTEGDVESLLSPFTKQKLKIYLQATARRAFVEFSDEDSAKAALQYFRMHPVQLKGANVNITMSKRDSVSTTHENANNTEQPFKILLTSVTNLLYCVDIDLIHFLFSKYGVIEKIVTFSRSEDAFQAFVQFKHASQAKNALVALHNRNIYDGCNTLQIQPSRLTDLVVKSNSAKGIDYTLQNHKSHDGNGVGNGGVSAGNNSSYSKYTGAIGLGVLPTPNTLPNHFSNSSSYGGGNMAGASLYGASLHHNSMHMNNHIANIYDKLPREIKEMNIENCNRNQTPVLICYHLTEDITVQKLFNLFSLYGNVVRIKILRDKPDTALIQYSEPFYASLAFNFLQNANMNGNELQISFSKNHEVKLPTSASSIRNGISNGKFNCANNSNDKNNNDNSNEHLDNKTKTFQYREQRYSGLVDDLEKYVRGASRPTGTLFIANLHESVTELEIKKLFSTYGDVEKISFKSPRDNSKTQMVVVAMNNELQALNALMNLHNSLLHNRSIKVAFSKTVLN